jgi:hypothetical protein
VPAPAVERGPRHPQLSGHLLDRQQRVIRSSGRLVRGGGGPARSGLGSRGRPVRGSATTHAPLRPRRQVRPPAGGRRQAPARGCRAGHQGKEEEPRRRAVRRGGGWRGPALPEGKASGAGTWWSRAVIDGTPWPLLGAEAPGPVASRRGGLACRLGPQASSLHSGRPVKPTRPWGRAWHPAHGHASRRAGYPPRQEGLPVERAGRPVSRRGARWHAPARYAQRKVCHGLDWSSPAAGFRLYSEIGFCGPFFTRSLGIGAGEARLHGCYGWSGYLRWPFVYLTSACRVPGAKRRRPAP